MTQAPEKPSEQDDLPPVPHGHVRLTIDDRVVDAPQGELLIRTCERLGIVVPRFCDHPLLDPAGACRQCLVEVEMGGRKMPKPQASCTMTVAQDMVVNTQMTSAVADKAQQGVMELLLINHPLDCPICDKGGECPLQNQAMSSGRAESRFVEEKRTFAKPLPISDEVLLDRERCVLCQRCTRFSRQIAGDQFIELLERGAHQQIGTEETAFGEGEDFQSYFSGNTIQICPVGALTSASYRFRSRPFDLVSTPGRLRARLLGRGGPPRLAARRGHPRARRRGPGRQRGVDRRQDPLRVPLRAVGHPDHAPAGAWRRRRAARGVVDRRPRARRGGPARRARRHGARSARRGGRARRAQARRRRAARRAPDDRGRLRLREVRPRRAGDQRHRRPRPRALRRGARLPRRARRRHRPRARDLRRRSSPRRPCSSWPSRSRRRRPSSSCGCARRPARARRCTTSASGRRPAVVKTGGRLVRTAPGREPRGAGHAARRGGRRARDCRARWCWWGSAPPRCRVSTPPVSELVGAHRGPRGLGAASGGRARRGGRRRAADRCCPADAPSTTSTRAALASSWGLADETALPATPGRDGAAILRAAAYGELAGLVVGGVELADLPDPALARAALREADVVVCLEQRRVRGDAVRRRGAPGGPGDQQVGDLPQLGGPRPPLRHHDRPLGRLVRTRRRHRRDHAAGLPRARHPRRRDGRRPVHPDPGGRRPPSSRVSATARRRRRSDRCDEPGPIGATPPVELPSERRRQPAAGLALAPAARRRRAAGRRAGARRHGPPAEDPALDGHGRGGSGWSRTRWPGSRARAASCTCPWSSPTCPDDVVWAPARVPQADGGVVTLAGLGLAHGGPARRHRRTATAGVGVNPVPRRATPRP